MNKYIGNKYFIILCQLFVALVFIFAGAEKINNAESFAAAISNYRMLPDFTINFIAITLPWIEFISGLLLLFNVHVRENIAILNALLFLFIVMVSIAVIRDLNIECGCFGAGCFGARNGQKVGLLKIGENILLFLAGLNVYLNKEIKGANE
jgi:uncharacterized membrane protein YphA (DoxX/SURF4 family)